MSEYHLGHELQYQDQTWRIVRIIAWDKSLFEDETGTYEVNESYVQIKSTAGQIDHIVLDSTKLPYTGPASTIKALEPLSWRPK